MKPSSSKQGIGATPAAKVPLKAGVRSAARTITKSKLVVGLDSDSDEDSDERNALSQQRAAGGSPSAAAAGSSRKAPPARPPPSSSKKSKLLKGFSSDDSEPEDDGVEGGAAAGSRRLPSAAKVARAGPAGPSLAQVAATLPIDNIYDEDTQPDIDDDDHKSGHDSEQDDGDGQLRPYLSFGASAQAAATLPLGTGDDTNHDDHASAVDDSAHLQRLAVEQQQQRGKRGAIDLASPDRPSSQCYDDLDEAYAGQEGGGDGDDDEEEEEQGLLEQQEYDGQANNNNLMEQEDGEEVDAGDNAAAIADDNSSVAGDDDDDDDDEGVELGEDDEEDVGDGDAADEDDVFLNATQAVIELLDSDGENGDDDDGPLPVGGRARRSLAEASGTAASASFSSAASSSTGIDGFGSPGSDIAGGSLSPSVLNTTARSVSRPKKRGLTLRELQQQVKQRLSQAAGGSQADRRSYDGGSDGDADEDEDSDGSPSRAGNVFGFDYPLDASGSSQPSSSAANRVSTVKRKRLSFADAAGAAYTSAAATRPASSSSSQKQRQQLDRRKDADEDGVSEGSGESCLDISHFYDEEQQELGRQQAKAAKERKNASASSSAAIEGASDDEDEEDGIEIDLFDIEPDSPDRPFTAAAAGGTSAYAQMTAGGGRLGGVSWTGFPDPHLPFFKPIQLLNALTLAGRETVNIAYNAQFKGAAGLVAVDRSTGLVTDSRKGGHMPTPDLKRLMAERQRSRKSLLAKKAKKSKRGGGGGGISVAPLGAGQSVAAKWSWQTGGRAGAGGSSGSNKAAPAAGGFASSGRSGANTFGSSSSNSRSSGAYPSYNSGPYATSDKNGVYASRVQRPQQMRPATDRRDIAAPFHPVTSIVSDITRLHPAAGSSNNSGSSTSGARTLPFAAAGGDNRPRGLMAMPAPKPKPPLQQTNTAFGLFPR